MQITSDPYILACVSGYKLEFANNPFQQHVPNQIKFSPEEHSAISTELNRLIEIGAVEKCAHEQGEFISNIFARVKANGKIRVILNLKPLNKFLVYEHFKMEHLDFVTNLVYKHDWFASIDLTDAYFSIPIHESDWKYLKFYWDGKLYYFKVLVFGLSLAPRVFTRICKPILAKLRGDLNTRCSLYIDDMLLINDSYQALKQNLDSALKLLTSLGFTINTEKSVLTPTQRIKHLGLVINSRTLSLGLPHEKFSILEEKCKRLMEKSEKVKIQNVASLLGLLSFSAQGTMWGKLFYRELERVKTVALKSSGGNFEAYTTLSKEALGDLQWWLSPKKETPYQFVKSQPVLTLYSDASNSGWGGHYKNQSAGGQWSDWEATEHINWLELKACWLTIQCFAKSLKNCHIALKLDNTCAISYINNQGGIIKNLNKLANELWIWCMERNIWVSASHIPGIENTLADHKSRVFCSNTEWALCDKDFALIVSNWDEPKIDLFASRLNYKVDNYISWQTDPHSTHIDAFTVFWGNLGLCYAFPPFNMIGSVLAKVRRERAEVLLVVPNWVTQYWYPLIKFLLVEKAGTVNPLTLSRNQHTIYLPFDMSAVHPIWSKLNLLCFRLSGRR